MRLEISSSNFPRFDRNPNTGHELFTDAEMRPALQSVMHERSCIVSEPAGNAQAPLRVGEWRVASG